MGDRTQSTTREHMLFILRVWRDTPDDRWRLAIQPSGESQPRGLPDSAALQAYVDTVMQGNELQPVESGSVSKG